MKKFVNFFEEERKQYQPLLPSIFQECCIFSIVEGATPNTLHAVASLFPKIQNQPLIYFRKAHTSKDFSPLRVGVVFSGGQAAGGHNVILGLFDALQQMHPQSKLFGFLEGPSGIIQNKYCELQAAFINNFRNTGGFDMIGSGRTKIETPDQFEAALKSCNALQLDGLVVIGGDDSNTNAAFLAEYFCTQKMKTQVIGIPKTIDGDLKNSYIHSSFGFDTACKIYSSIIGNICRDALSAKKYTHFIRLMGRSASHIALECALQTQPNITLIGEEIANKKMTVEQITESICDCLMQRASRGKEYAVILIPEGIIEFIPEIKRLIQELNSLLAKGNSPLQHLTPEARGTYEYLPKEIAEQLLIDRDPHGNVQVSRIETEKLFIYTVQQTLKKRNFSGKFSPVSHFLGYEGRCGYPSNFDANYCYTLGYTAAGLIVNNLSGYMSAVQNLTEPLKEWQPIGIPLTSMMDMEERKGKEKAVIKKTLVHLEGTVFKYFASLRDIWAIEDCYIFPGPIQFNGFSKVCDAITYTLELEQSREISKVQ